MTTTQHLRELMGKATKVRSTKLLSLTGGMANEALLEIGDPHNGGRSLQMPKADALFHAALSPEVVAKILDVVDAARLLMDRPDFWNTRTSIPGEYDTLKDSLAALDEGEAAHDA